MPKLKIMTFNVENMLVRYNFRKWEKEGLVTLLDIDSEADRANLIRTHWNILNDENRVFTALTIKEAAPDVICFQEVENLRALRAFHDRYLRRIWREFEYIMLIEGNDPRGIDVAVLSRFRIVSATTHQDVKKKIPYPDPNKPKMQRVFRRDCLEVNVKRSGKILPIFVCHFKSMSGGRSKTRPVREAEAQAVREIIENRFEDPSKSDWIIVGDMNDYTETDGQTDNGHALGALLDGGFSKNLVKRIDDAKERWTHYYASDNEYHQLDYILVSPSLAEKNPDVKPTIVRNGQPFRADRYKGERWPRVGYNRPKASDHCPVAVNLTI